jgi:hypothetical protein
MNVFGRRYRRRCCCNCVLPQTDRVGAIERRREGPPPLPQRRKRKRRRGGVGSDVHHKPEPPNLKFFFWTRPTIISFQRTGRSKGNQCVFFETVYIVFDEKQKPYHNEKARERNRVCLFQKQIVP